MDTSNKLKSYLEKAVDKAAKAAKISLPRVSIEISETKDAAFGDVTTNAAFLLAKAFKRKPIDLAAELMEHLPKMPEVEQVQVAPPGYINFYLSKSLQFDSLDGILKSKDKYGSSTLGQGQTINIEFVSANPTGPLTLANARGGFLGDVLANVLSFAGFSVTREYYLNDSAYNNTQIQMLGRSVLVAQGIIPAAKDAQYGGDYIDSVAKKVLKRESGLKTGKDIYLAGNVAAEVVMADMIIPTLTRMGIRFDSFIHENEFYETGAVPKAVTAWQKQGMVYEKEGALWFKTTKHGAAKDAVVRRSNGAYVYLAADILYHFGKLKERKFARTINLLGADHHGEAAQLKSALGAFGLADRVTVIIMQFVRLVAGGREVKMSKRAGNFVSVDELLDEVGADAARFFMVSRSADTHLDFDLELAKQQSAKNPVYYIQYAYARLSGIIRNTATSGGKATNIDWSLLDTKEEQALIRELLRWPGLIEEVSEMLNPQVIAHYALKVADVFHVFYDHHRVLVEDKKLAQARLALVHATRITLGNVLSLMGISRPETM